MIWVVLGWVLIGLAILFIELAWLSVAGTLLRDGGSKKDKGSLLLFVWGVLHLAAMIVGGVLLISQVG